MTNAVKELLESFDALSADEKRDAARILFERLAVGEAGDLGDDALLAAADGLFAELDAREAAGETR